MQGSRSIPRAAVAAAFLLLAGCTLIVETDPDALPYSWWDASDDGGDTRDGMDTEPDEAVAHDWSVDPDTAVDVPSDGLPGECSDGIDNDGDNLVDTEDFDCADPSDPLEGPDDGAGTCSVDNHCLAGWEECDRDTGTCYDPPQGDVCASCSSSTDCGDGGTGWDDPDTDYCLPGGECTKDCAGDFDCPRGFNCVDNYGELMCLPRAGTCDLFLDVMGSMCMDAGDCGEYMVCYEGEDFCTTDCVIEHDCRYDMSCVDGFCVPD